MQDDTWDFDIQQALKSIEEHEAKNVLLQFPDGLKMHAHKVREQVLSSCDVDEVFVWAGSNFGACDLPIEARNVGVDLIIHFGHSPWDYRREVVQ